MKNVSATTKLVTLAELFAGFGSVRKLVAETTFWIEVFGGAVTLATIVKLMPESLGVGCRVAIFPVTVPLVPTVGPVQVPKT